MASLKQLFSQSVVYGLSTVIPRLLNYLLVPIHTRGFSNPESYGIITELYAYIAFLLVLLTFGLETGFFRFASKQSDSDRVYSTIFYFIFLTSVVASTLFFTLSGSISTLLGPEFNPRYIQILGFVVATDAFMSIPFAKLRLDNRPLAFSLVKILGVSVNVGLNLLIYFCLRRGLFVNYVNEQNLLLLIFAANLIQNLTVTFVVLLLTNIPPISIDSTLLRTILRYSLPLLIAGLAGTTNEAMDRIFIRYLLPADHNALYDLGIYSSNVKLAVLMLLFIQMYRFAAEPFFFNLNESKNGISSLFPKTQKYFIVFCSMIFLGITFNIPILKYIVGVEYRQSLYIVPLLLIANILYGTYFNLSFWYKLSDKTIYGIKYTAIGAFITIISNIILIPMIGIYGAAISRIICYASMNFLSYRDGRRANFVGIEMDNIFKYALLFAIIVIVGFSLLPVSQWLSVVICDVLILIFAYLFIRYKRIELPFFGSIVKK